jgi:hypothetical protein
MQKLFAKYTAEAQNFITQGGMTTLFSTSYLICEIQN